MPVPSCGCGSRTIGSLATTATAAEARLAERARRRHRISLRHRAAQQLIQLGERLAAEPSLAPARSR